MKTQIYFVKWKIQLYRQLKYLFISQIMSNAKPDNMSSGKEGDNHKEEDENAPEERVERDPEADLIHLLIGLVIILVVGLHKYIFGQEEEVYTFCRQPHH